MSNQLKSLNESWNVQTTEFATMTENPLRKIWEGNQKVAPNPRKEVITLQIGDPTVFGNFPVANESIDAIKRALDVDNFGYYPSAGLESARQAVAEYFTENSSEAVTAKDVILTSGCSMALETCFRALANPGDNILVPRPCWNYTTWLSGCKIEARSYNLDPKKNWDVDLKHMESQINEQTKAILVNSPGNPCGNVFSASHILNILEIAERYRIPIIADEIYETFAFPGVKYQSICSLSKNVPILTCGGLSKRFLMPGIRMGWVVINDRNNSFRSIRQGLANISGRHFGPSSTIQVALPEILKNTPQEFFDCTNERISQHAKTAYKIFKTVQGLNPIMPKGAMYMMIGIDLNKFPTFSSCLEFTQELTREQSVQTFPGDPCFYYPGFMRIVLTVPENMIIIACIRIKEFCEKHYKDDANHPRNILNGF